MKIYNIEQNGKIVAQTSYLEVAKAVVRLLGSGSFVSCNDVVFSSNSPIKDIVL